MFLRRKYIEHLRDNFFLLSTFYNFAIVCNFNMNLYMPTFAIESNGRIEKTAVYYNGEQLGGIKEIFIHIDENGAFDSVIQYEGADKVLYTKDIFKDYLTNIKVVPPVFSAEEAKYLQLIEFESEGSLDHTTIFYNNESLIGVVNIFIHIKSNNNTDGVNSIFSLKRKVNTLAEFKAEITFRNEDDTIETERIF